MYLPPVPAALQVPFTAISTSTVTASSKTTPTLPRVSARAQKRESFTKYSTWPPTTYAAPDCRPESAEIYTISRENL